MLTQKLTTDGELYQIICLSWNAFREKDERFLKMYKVDKPIRIKNLVNIKKALMVIFENTEESTVTLE
jgi:hypothetical protein